MHTFALGSQYETTSLHFRFIFSISPTSLTDDGLFCCRVRECQAEVEMKKTE